MAPTAMHGRVIAVYTAVSYGIQPLTALWIGWAAQDSVLGVSAAIQFNAMLLIAGTLGLFVFRRIILQHEYLKEAEMEITSGLPLLTDNGAINVKSRYSAPEI
jgi:hypothetical protein